MANLNIANRTPVDKSFSQFIPTIQEQPKRSQRKASVCIYVACLAAYNSGYLHGAWIDANQDVTGICRDVQIMLSESPIENAEEWAIQCASGGHV